jgi:hypothetical protein
VERNRDRPGPGAYHQPLAARVLPGVTRWAALTRAPPPPKKEKWAPYAMAGPQSAADRAAVLKKSRAAEPGGAKAKSAAGAARAAAGEDGDAYSGEGFE